MSARLRITLAAMAGVAVLAGPAFADPPATDCHGVAVSDAANDQYIGVSTTNALVRPSSAIDVTSVYLTGADGDEVVNIKVTDLTGLNVAFRVQWDDPENLGGYYALSASFTGTNGTGSAGGYGFEHGNGSATIFRGTTGTAFTGPGGVVQIALPSDVEWPATLTNIDVRAEQYESNALQEIALRVDTAGAASWAQPC